MTGITIIFQNYLKNSYKIDALEGEKNDNETNGKNVIKWIGYISDTS